MEEKGLPVPGRDPVALFERAHRVPDCEKCSTGSRALLLIRDPVTPFRGVG